MCGVPAARLRQRRARRTARAPQSALVCDALGEQAIEHSRPRRCEVLEHGDGACDGHQCLFPPPHLVLPDRAVAQRQCEVGEKRVRVRGRQALADLHRTADRHEGFLVPAQFRQPVGLVVQRHGEAGQKHLVARGRQLLTDLHRTHTRRQRLLPPSRLGKIRRQIVQRHRKVRKREPQVTAAPEMPCQPARRAAGAGRPWSGRCPAVIR